MKKTMVRYSFLFVMPFLMGIHMYLSLSDLPVPFGISLEEEEKTIYKHGWNGAVIEKVHLTELTKEDEVEFFLMDHNFNQRFANVIFTILVLVYYLVLEGFSRLWNISLQGWLKIPEKWEPVLFGVTAGFIFVTVVLAGVHYTDLLQESEALLQKYQE